MSAYQLGVLFVHGIGDQRKGQCLQRLATPLASWLHRWLEGDPGADPDFGAGVSKVTAEPIAVDSGLTSVSMRLEFPGERSQKWLLAESWWQGDIAPPPFWQLVKWGGPLLPTIITEFMWSYLRRAFMIGNIFTLLLAVLLILLSPVIALAILALAVVMLVADKIPFLSKYVRKYTLSSARSIGDSYLLINDPVQKAVMVGRVLQDLSAMTAKCDRVVLVGHSQGAALAHIVSCRHLGKLPATQASKFAGLITMGSAVWRIRSIYALRHTGHLLWTVAGLGILGGICIAAAGVQYGRDLVQLLVDLSFTGKGASEIKDATGVPVKNWYMGLGVIVTLLALLQFGINRYRETKNNAFLYGLGGLILASLVVALVPFFNVYGPLSDLFSMSATESSIAQQWQKLLRGLLPVAIGILCLAGSVGSMLRSRPDVSYSFALPAGLNVVWRDYMATFDPVRMGSLGRNKIVPGSTQTDVDNFRSALRDHSSYERNFEFVTHFAIDLLQLANAPLESAYPGRLADEELREMVSRTRRGFTTVMSFARGFIVTAALLMLGGLAAKQSAVFTGHSMLHELGSHVPENVPALIPIPGARSIGEGGWGLIAILVGAGLVLASVSLVWAAWAPAMAKTVFASPRPGHDGPSGWLMWTVFAYGIFLFLAISAMLHAGFGWTDARDVPRIALQTVALLAIGVTQALMSVTLARFMPAFNKEAQPAE